MYKKLAKRLRTKWILLLVPILLLSSFFIVQNLPGTTLYVKDSHVRTEKQWTSITESPQVKGDGSYGTFSSYSEGKQLAREYLQTHNDTDRVYWTYGKEPMYVYVTYLTTEGSGGGLGLDIDFGDVPGFEIPILLIAIFGSIVYKKTKEEN